jgi:hydrogenase/urease accessory protein HupE
VGTDVTRRFEEEFAAWQGVRYAMGFKQRTAAIHAALFGCGVGAGDENHLSQRDLLGVGGAGFLVGRHRGFRRHRSRYAVH